MPNIITNDFNLNIDLPLLGVAVVSGIIIVHYHTFYLTRAVIYVSILRQTATTTIYMGRCHSISYMHLLVYFIN